MHSNHYIEVQQQMDHTYTKKLSEIQKKYEQKYEQKYFNKYQYDINKYKQIQKQEDNMDTTFSSSDASKRTRLSQLRKTADSLKKQLKEALKREQKTKAKLRALTPNSKKIMYHEQHGAVEEVLQLKTTLVQKNEEIANLEEMLYGLVQQQEEEQRLQEERKEHTERKEEREDRSMKKRMQNNKKGKKREKTTGSGSIQPFDDSLVVSRSPSRMSERKRRAKARLNSPDSSSASSASSASVQLVISPPSLNQSHTQKSHGQSTERKKKKKMMQKTPNKKNKKNNYSTPNSDAGEHSSSARSGSNAKKKHQQDEQDQKDRNDMYDFKLIRSLLSNEKKPLGAMFHYYASKRQMAQKRPMVSDVGHLAGTRKKKRCRSFTPTMYMTLSDWFKFSFDFSIIPSLLSKTKMKTIFVDIISSETKQFHSCSHSSAAAAKQKNSQQNSQEITEYKYHEQYSSKEDRKDRMDRMDRMASDDDVDAHKDGLSLDGFMLCLSLIAMRSSLNSPSSDSDGDSDSEIPEVNSDGGADVETEEEKRVYKYEKAIFGLLQWMERSRGKSIISNSRQSVTVTPFRSTMVRQQSTEKGKTGSGTPRRSGVGSGLRRGTTPVRL